MDEEKKKEEVEETEPKEKHEDVETKSEEEVKAEPETSEDSETTEDKPERTPVEDAVSDAVNDGDARALADLSAKVDTILNILSDMKPTFNANDSEEKHEEDDKTSEAELEAYENLLD